ncbi:sigma 54-interacting transcriptional regulator [Alicyclobacillus cycloheptanicus]|uniref:HTH-type transcriptional regulatory protein TyrR n=1 Tax=Alicyclobacillus cycloheptanicus TaxID=1457 RepID=A0ABT9XGD4_9BACL|nr:sigma 54-interacting transcriptional regulator [Alicyclobacillus cycloheptanicus]MDQ0189356.1 PAS domain S-box-containing protein [Alicyclobacillus cycloheptanicus]WDM01290.1 sigma 54-interacting transcriptional regulator [Alicyclobacillus cycloheptanicus]
MIPAFLALNVLDTPILFFNEHDQLTWANDAAHATFSELKMGQVWNTMPFPDGYLYQLHAFSHEFTVGTLVECIRNEDISIRSENHVLQARNRELERLLDAASDELFVTDGDGRILLVNQSTESFYEMKLEDIIGRTVFELEEQRVFYPSVTAMVLRERRRQTILQKTRDGRNLAVTGTPVVNDNGDIVRVISTAIDLHQLAFFQPEMRQNGNPYDFGEAPAEAPFDTKIIAESQPMRDLQRRINRLASFDAAVLLMGETGVGKNVLANHIHKISRRSSEPFVEINCATIPDALFESELFGYERGAFTGSNRSGKPGKVEVAHGGTLFLDEIGEIPLHMQSKLLDLVQNHTFTRVGSVHSKTVDVRIIAATNRDLREMVEKGLFRADLYYRLDVIKLHVPPLRERLADIPALSMAILSDLAKRHRQPPKTLHPSTVSVLQSYPWPGNIRELHNVLEQVVVWQDAQIILPIHLPEHVQHHSQQPSMDIHHPGGDDDIRPLEGGLSELLNRYERQVLQHALARWGTTYAIAEQLKVSQPTVSRKLKKHGLI